MTLEGEKGPSKHYRTLLFDQHDFGPDSVGISETLFRMLNFDYELDGTGS